MIGLFGGTFDPVHCGHLRAAHEARVALGLDRVLMVPCGDPPHRGRPRADGEQRLAWLRTAVGDHPYLIADDRELRRNGPSYTVDTLAELRHEVGPSEPVVLLLGVDAFLGLTGWHRWEQLLALAHLAILHRPDSVLPTADPTGDPLQRLLASRRCDSPCALRDSPSGRLHTLAITPLAISSTAVRRLLQDGGDPCCLVPDRLRDALMASDAYRAACV